MDRISTTNINRFVIKHERIVFPLLFVILVAFMYAPVVFFGKTLVATEYYPDGVTGLNTQQDREAINSFNIDLATPAYYETPINRAVGEMYLNGDIPLWDPYQASGMPLAAQYSTRAFFPYQILEDVTAPRFWDFFILARLWIAGYFTFLFLRLLSVSRRGALLGGIFFMYSGTMVWFINLEQMANIAMLVPLLLYSFEKIVSTTRPVYYLLAIVSVALVLLGGNPEVAAYVLLLAGIYSLFRIWTVNRTGKERMAGLGKVVAIAVLGLGLAAPLVITFLDFTSYGHNVHPSGGPLGISSVPVSFWATSITNPTFFELPTWERWPPINGVWDFLGGYSGVLPLLLAVLGLVKSRGHRRLLIFFGAFGLVILLKNFGVPPFLWLGKLPLLDQIWSPRWAGPAWTFCFAIAGALGFESLLNSSEKNHGSEQIPVAKNPTGLLSEDATLNRWDIFNRWLGCALLITAVVFNRFTLANSLESVPSIGTVSSLFMLTIRQIAFIFAGGFLLLSRKPFTLLPKPQEQILGKISYSFWWIPYSLVLSVMIIATNYPSLLTDTHPLTPKPVWPDIIPNLAASVGTGGLIACLILAITWFIVNNKYRPGVLTALIPLALMEAWFLVPRGYNTEFLFLKVIPVLLAGAAIVVFILKKKLLVLCLALLAVFSTFTLDLTASNGFPDRTDAFQPAPFVEFLQKYQESEDCRIMATDGILMPNFASAVNLYDVRYMNTVVLEQYQSYTKYLSGVEWRQTDASSVVFSGRPEVVPEIPIDQYGYSVAKVPMRESFEQNIRYYSLLGVRYLVTPTNHEFVYTDGFGDWVNIDLPNWTSGIIRTGGDYFYKEASSIGTWKREGNHLGVFSDTIQSLVYKFVFEEPIHAGFIHSWFRISEEGGSARIFVSSDGEVWGTPLVDINGVNPQYVSRITLPESVEEKTTLFIRFDGNSPSANDSVSLEQWGIWTDFAGEISPFRYVIDGVVQSEIQPLAALPLVYDDEVRIYENTKALPHAFISHDIQRVGSPEEAWDLLKDPGTDMYHTVFCEDYIPGLDIDATIPASDTDKVSIDEYGPNKVVMTANVENLGIMVLNDSYAPGWKATINGKPTAIHRINGLVRGVFVDAGENQIIFKYQPKGFSLGIIIALICAVISLGWYFNIRYSRKPDKHTLLTQELQD